MGDTNKIISEAESQILQPEEMDIDQATEAGTIEAH